MAPIDLDDNANNPSIRRWQRPQAAFLAHRQREPLTHARKSQHNASDPHGQALRCALGFHKAAGQEALTAAKAKVRELFGELFEDEEDGDR